MKNELHEIIDHQLREIHDELTRDILEMKTAYPGEAKYMALQLLRAGIMPKTEEFYKEISRVKTWCEIMEEYKQMEESIK